MLTGIRSYIMSDSHINRTLYWDDVEDDWTCMHCKKTKYQGVNFFVHIRTNGKPSVSIVCNTCKGKGLSSGRSRGGYRKEYIPKLNIKQKIDKYFKENYND